MPFKSVAQQHFLYANKPELAKEFAKKRQRQLIKSFQNMLKIRIQTRSSLRGKGEKNRLHEAR